MYVIAPIDLADKVVYSSASELYPAWVPGGSYAVDDVVSVLDSGALYLQTRLTEQFCTHMLAYVVGLGDPFPGCYAFLQTLVGGRMLADVNGSGGIELSDAIVCLKSLTGMVTTEAQYAWIYSTLIPAIQEKVLIDPTNYGPYLQSLPVGIAYGTRYRRRSEGAGTLPPGLDTDNWLMIGPTNPKAMFDREVSTSTTASGALQVVVAPGYATALGLFGLVGTELQITIQDGPAGAIVYGNALLTGPAVISLATEDLNQQAFEAPAQLDSYTVANLPAYENAHITVTITGTGPVACGVIDVGVAYNIGGAQRGASMEINDFSRKTTDEFGVTTFVKRGFSKRVNLTTLINSSELSRVTNAVSSLNGAPCTWVATDDATLETFDVFGWFEGFSVAVEHVGEALVTLSIQGLTR